MHSNHTRLDSIIEEEMGSKCAASFLFHEISRSSEHCNSHDECPESTSPLPPLNSASQFLILLITHPVLGYAGNCRMSTVNGLWLLKGLHFLLKSYLQQFWFHSFVFFSLTNNCLHIYPWHAQFPQILKDIVNPQWIHLLYSRYFPCISCLLLHDKSLQNLVA